MACVQGVVCNTQHCAPRQRRSSHFPNPLRRWASHHSAPWCCRAGGAWFRAPTAASRLILHHASGLKVLGGGLGKDVVKELGGEVALRGDGGRGRG